METAPSFASEICPGAPRCDAARPEDPNLEGLEKIARFAEEISDQELEHIRKEKPNAIPGESPAWCLSRVVQNELSRCRERMRHEEPVTLTREELEQALSPLAAFQLILARAGQTDIDVDAQDMAAVLGTLLYASYTRIGYPLLGGGM